MLLPGLFMRSATAVMRELGRFNGNYVFSPSSGLFVTSGSTVRHTSQHRVILLPEIPKDDSKTNKLLIPPESELPHLSGVSERDCYFGLGKVLLEFESAVCSLEAKCQDGVVDFNALFGELEPHKCMLESVWHLVNLLAIVTNELDRDRLMQLHKRAERALLSRYASKDIFETLQKMKEAGGLNPQQERIVDRFMVEYKHQGYELPEKKFNELNVTWKSKLAEATRDYNFRHSQSTQRFLSTVRDPNVVRDFPVDVLRAMATDSSQPSKGPWNVTLHPYVYRKFLEYCPDRKLRWNVYQADVARGSRVIDEYLHTGSQVRGIRRFRADLASTLGYSNFADFSMVTKMAANVENVHIMIASLLARAKDAQERELEALQAYAEDRGFDAEIEFYDLPFFKRKQRFSMLGINEEDLRNFFPLPRVVTGIFRLCQNLFDLTIEEVKENVNAWSPEVKLFRVSDSHSGKLLGHFYFDPYIRDDKSFSGSDRGWYIPIRSLSKLGKSIPLGAMVLSFPTPGYGKPSLLSFAEVHELLRNMGNMLIHLLSDTDWSDLSGKTGIEWDALEVASNFMTHWLYTPDFLSALSGHWSNNEPLSQELVDRLCLSKHHMAGYDLCHELFKASYDMAFHTEDYDNEGYQELSNRLHAQYSLIPRVQEDTFPLYFSEIMGGDKPAAYFCETWSKMLAADAFSAVQEVGFDNTQEVKKVTKRFRKTFLSFGSSLPAADVFRQFRGRDPSHEALLLSLGLKGLHHPKKRGFQQASEQS